MHHTKSKISGMISKGFKADKCKVSLRMAMSRMKLLRNKREVQVRQTRRDVAQLLQSGQDQTARIRVEHVIREEKTMAAYELLELYCELIVARLSIIDSQKNCPIDLQEAISSVIFASPRCADVQELMDVCKQFQTKYGKEFTTAALEIRPDSGVSHMIVEKLSAKAPDTETKIKTLKSIAEEHGVEWDSKALLDELQKPKNDLLTAQIPSKSQTATHHSATTSAHTLTQPKPTPFLSASQVATGYSGTRSGTDINTGEVSFTPAKNEDSAEDIVAKPPDGQIPLHGGFISSTGTVIYPPPPPPFMKSEESAPSSSQSEFTSPERASIEEITKQKYKDAKAAARAAAESAERAQMAAKAAAELARRENKARRKAQVEEDTYTMPGVGSVEDAQKQSETQNIHMHYDLVQDSQSTDEEEEEEEGITIHATSVAVFDESNSDIDDHATNLLDTFSQPKKEEHASDFYWREKADSIKQDRGESVFFEDSAKDASPPRFVNSYAPNFDSDGLSSDNEDESDIKAKKEEPKYIYSEKREEKEGAYDDEPALGFNFGKLTGGLKNKGYRRPPYVKRPIIDATSSVETIHDHDVYVSSRTKNLPSSDLDEVEASYVLSEETEKGQRGSKKSVSKVRKDDNIYFGENRHPESSDEENANESTVAEKSELEEDLTKSSASSSSTSVRYKRPPDYDSLTAHFRSLRANRP